MCPGPWRRQFHTRVYEHAWLTTRSGDDALAEGARGLRAVCFLFEPTGWRRLFQLQVHPGVANTTRPLHYRTTVNMQRNWLGAADLSLRLASQGRGVPESDYDLLVVVHERVGPGREMGQRANAARWRGGAPIDVVILTTEYVTEMLGAAASLQATVEREGRLLYAA